MAIGEIKVSTQVLRDTAEKVSRLSGELNELLENVYKRVLNLQSAYDSDSGKALIEGIKNLSPQFAEYKTVVESYAKFLRDAAQEYDETEQVLTTNAQNTAQFSQPS